MSYRRWSHIARYSESNKDVPPLETFPEKWIEELFSIFAIQRHYMHDSLVTKRKERLVFDLSKSNPMFQMIKEIEDYFLEQYLTDSGLESLTLMFKKGIVVLEVDASKNLTKRIFKEKNGVYKESTRLVSNNSNKSSQIKGVDEVLSTLASLKTDLLTDQEIVNMTYMGKEIVSSDKKPGLFFLKGIYSNARSNSLKIAGILNSTAWDFKTVFISQGAIKKSNPA